MTGHLYMHPPQFALHDSWDQQADHPLLPVAIPPEVLPALQWWVQASHFLQGIPLCSPSPSTPALHTCLHRGLGHPARDSPNLRHVEHITVVSLHQQLEAAGSPPCPPALTASGDQQLSGGDDRQHNSSRPDQESWRHPLVILVPSHCTPLKWADSLHISLIPRHMPGHLDLWPIAFPGDIR